MFHIARDELLDAIAWQDGTLQYVEAFKHIDGHPVPKDNFRSGALKGHEAAVWLQKSILPHHVGFRVLFCESSLFPNAQVCMTKDTFLMLEKEFELHHLTLPSLEIQGGAFSKHVRYFTKSDRVESISIILKAPQKWEIANYLLSMTYNATTRQTHAIVMGERVTEWMRWRDPIPKSANESVYINAAQTIEKMLRHSVELWHDPLLLPCVFMTDHLQRVHAVSAGRLTDSIMEIEDRLGVVHEGRRNRRDHLNMPEKAYKQAITAAENISKKGDVDKSEMADLTVQIHNRMTRVLFLKRSPEWNIEASEFLIRTDKEINSQRERSNLQRPVVSHEIAEMLAHNITIGKAADKNVQQLQYRMNLQLNVLYSFVGQTDNRLNARLAATTGRDSTSMKILAFITTLFLPGTFVATLFSMGLFDWQHTGPGDVVSSRFWIYWAVSLPLTLLTICGWALWWSFEKRRYNDDFGIL